MSEYDRLVAAVHARLERATRMQDVGPVLEDGVLTEARDLTQLIADDPGDLGARHVLGWLHWYRYQAMPETENGQDLRVSVFMFIPCFIEGMDPIPEPLLPILADQAAARATDLFYRAQGGGGQELLSAAVALWRRIIIATPDSHPDLGSRLSILGIALHSYFGHTGVLGDLDAAVDAQRRALQVILPDDPDRAVILTNLGIVLRDRFGQTEVLGDLDTSVDAQRQALQVILADDPNREAILSNLSIVLQDRFARTGVLGDLDAAVDAQRRALELIPAERPDYASKLSDLELMFFARFQRTGIVTDLDVAVEVGQQAVQAAWTDHPDRAAILSNLGVTLVARFERTGGMADLDAAVARSREAVQVTPIGHPGFAGNLANLGNALRTRYRRTGVSADLDAALEVGQEALQAIPPDHPDRAAVLSNLGMTRLSRFECTGMSADLDAAVQASQHVLAAIPLVHPDRAKYLSIHANALSARFEHAGALADLDAAVEAAQEAIQMTPAEGDDAGMRMSNLADMLRMRFERTGIPADLDAAIEVAQRAVQAAPTDHPDHARRLVNLGTALKVRATRTGALADLNAAVDAGRQAMRMVPADHTDRPAILSNLTNTLLERFWRAGAVTDLDAAVEIGRQSILSTPPEHLERGMRLANLANALQTRFELTGAVADLDAAITYLRETVQVAAIDDANRGGYLSNLGNALRIRFDRTGVSTDLDSSIAHLREATQVTAIGHSRRAGRLGNLGAALNTRFKQTGELEDLDAAIEVGQQAVQATPTDHPRRAVILSNRGNELHDRYERTGATADRDAAISMYEEAANAPSAAPSARIAAARAGAAVVAVMDPARAISLLETAVLLLPQVAPRFLDRDDQQYEIGRFAGLAADAAAMALSDPTSPEAQRPARALQLLEAARGILFSQALNTRGDLSDLRERHPELAERFAELRKKLDQPSSAADIGMTEVSGISNPDTAQRTIQDRRQVDTEFIQLLAQIRDLEGFGTFALPPSADQLKAQAAEGTVVIFNVSVYRSDAILLTSRGIDNCRLRDLDQATLISQINLFYQALHAAMTADSVRDRVEAGKTLRQILAWLWENAVNPVLHHLGHVKPPEPGEPWARLWWVQGGLLSLLPIHAAGHHTDPLDPGNRTVMDRVISSYVPTVAALAYGRARAATMPVTAGQSLIVAMPTTPDVPGEGRLAYVPAEAALLGRRLPRPLLLTEPSAASEVPVAQIPTRAAVLEHLPHCAIAHFACHGLTDPDNPSQSRLLLHDHQRNPLTVAVLAPVALEQVQLAYLSACATARSTNIRLLDEVIHLTSAFQLAGFPHVIGTLWEINDALAVQIADSFYAAIIDADGSIDTNRAAHALHHAVRSLRAQRPTAPYLWASYIHAGA